jgi:hypothetical protein
MRDALNNSVDDPDFMKDQFFTARDRTDCFQAARKLDAAIRKARTNGHIAKEASQ